jgi:PAS domain-containing protein
MATAQTGNPEIDYTAVFRNLPTPVLLLTPEFVIADANLAYLRVAGRERADLLGRHVLDAFPDNPSEPAATGADNLSASLRRVVATGQRDAMALQKYDVEVPGHPGVFQERYWSPVNAPVPGTDGRVVLIAHWVEEVSDLVLHFARAQAASA